MDGAWLVRVRWRHRGAWLWPMFVIVSALDGVIGYELPVSGDRQSLAAGIVVGLVLNLLAVLFLSRPLGALLRRRRRDLPVGVARNYAGTTAVVLVSVGFVAAGLANHANIQSNDVALRDAMVRAQAFIGADAPAEFRRNVNHPTTVTIQAGSVYRTCVPNDRRTRTYCVVVRRSLPFAHSVKFDGYEPNSVFAAGAG